MRVNIRKFLWIIAIALLLLVTAGGYTSFSLYSQYAAIDEYKIPQRSEAYEVEAGSNAKMVAVDLVGEEFPHLLLRIWVQAHGDLTAIQKGSYAIDGSKNLADTLKDMVEGNVVEKIYPTWLVVEGDNVLDVLNRLKKIKDVEKDSLRSLNNVKSFIVDSLKDPFLIEAVGGPHDTLEGLLMPATYPVFDHMPTSFVVSRALKDMAMFMLREWKNRDLSISLKNPYEALIMASIIERETLLDSERPKVAAVFYNRIKKGMRLQTDPTVMYGIAPNFKGRLTKSMLNVDTAYNTYTRAGLPPSPISMPSRESILAALHPENIKALYFVARNISPADGHVFSNSLKEHNSAVAEYRKKVKAYRQKNSKEKDSKDSEQKSDKKDKS